MKSNRMKEHVEALRLHAEEHEVIKDGDFKTIEEYVLHLMHTSDYQKAALLARGKSVLDLGCNGGYGTSIVGKVCSQITGVDVSPAAISAAKKRYESDNTHFMLVDGFTLPFPAQAFDLVTSFQVIEHLADCQAYFNEIKRVLKPNGVLLLTTPNAAIRVHPGQKPWNHFHVREFLAEELVNLAKNHFECAQVFGQFAVEKTYSIEYNRCIAARGQATTEPSLGRKIFRRMPQPIIASVRSIRDRLKTRQVTKPDNVEFGNHAVEDFYYKTNFLDKSLSLVACCAASEVDSNAAAIIFLGNGK